MANKRVHRGRLIRSLFPILAFASALFSKTPPNRAYGLLDSHSAPARAVRLPDAVPVERVFISGEAIRPVAYRLGYEDFISEVESIDRQSRSGITTA